MKTLVSKIRDIMKESEISSYSLAKITGISEGQLSMIFNNKRRMTADQFNAISENLPIPLDLKKKFIDEFYNSYYSQNDYCSIKQITAMIKQLSDLTVYETGTITLAEPVKLEKNFEDKIYRGTNIGLVLEALISNEFAIGDGKIYMYLGNIEENNILSSYIDIAVRKYRHKNKLCVIYDFSNRP